MFEVNHNTGHLVLRCGERCGGRGGGGRGVNEDKTELCCRLEIRRRRFPTLRLGVLLVSEKVNVHFQLS